MTYTLLFFLRTLIAVSALIACITALAGLKTAFLLSSVGAGIMVLLLLLVRRGYPRVASLLLIVTWNAIGIIALVTGDGIHDVAIIIFPAAMITASLLLSRALFAGMPVKGGWATFDALKKAAPKVRVLLASGYSLDGEAQEVLDRGAKGFIQKPFLRAELSRVVREALIAES